MLDSMYAAIYITYSSSLSPTHKTFCLTTFAEKKRRYHNLAAVACRRN